MGRDREGEERESERKREREKKNNKREGAASGFCASATPIYACAWVRARRQIAYANSTAGRGTIYLAYF